MREMRSSSIISGETIPRDWTERKFNQICKRITDFVASGSFADLRNNVQYLDEPDYAMLVRTTDLSKSVRSEGRVYISKESYQFLSNSNLFGGEIVLPNIGSIGDAYVVPSNLYPKMSLAPNAITFSTNFCDKYYYYYFLSKIGNKQLRDISESTAMPKFNKTDLRQLKVLCPPLFEQQRIADFLDRKCADINNVLEKTKASIEEYKKLKQSVITEAVTKGIRGERPMKDSGIEWIGTIPEDWQIMKLRHIGYCQNGISKGSEFFGEGNPFVSYSDVYKNFSLPHDVSGRIQSTASEQELYSVKRGDIFFTRTSETIEEIGFSSVCLFDIPQATFAGFVIRVRPYKDTLLPEFSKYYFRSNIHGKYFIKEMNLVTRASLGQGLLKGLPVIVPCVKEQKEIATYLNTKCSEIDALIDSKEAFIKELESYRKSLIYEYVTGKKEVTT